MSNAHPHPMHFDDRAVEQRVNGSSDGTEPEVFVS
jgi:hypothetical protein